MSKRVRRPALVLALVGLAGCGLWASADDGLEVGHWRDLSCAAIAVPPGPEDTAIDHAGGKAYVASTDRRALAGHRPATERIGRLSLLDLKQARPQAINVTPEGMRAGIFQPHGIDLWPGAQKRLFAVNRRPAFDRETGRWDSCDLSNAIEVFAVGDHGLRHIETIDSPHLVRPNDVAPTSEQTFYVTNDHGTRACWAQNLRDLFGLNRGHVLYYDGSTFGTAASDVPFANGLAYDRARHELYVASSLEGTIERFTAKADGALDRRISIRLGTAPDNLTVGRDGRVPLAAHPDRWRFLLYARRWFGAESAPSQIIEIASPSGEDPRAVEIWRDDGELIPAASAAAVYHWQEEGTLRLLIGAVFTDHVLLCDRPEREKDGPGEPGPQSRFGEAGNEINVISGKPGVGQGTAPR